MTIQFKAWSHVLTARLSRHIALWVFTSIVAIEVVILVPSALRREREQLDQIQQTSDTAVAVLSRIIPPDATSLDVLDLLQTSQLTPSVRGGSLYGLDGTLIGQFGEEPALPFAQAQQLETLYRQSRYDVAWHISSQGENPAAETEPTTYILVLRHDAGSVRQAVYAFVVRIAGLVLIITLFVTSATLLVLGATVITPILQLRQDLMQAGSAVENNKPLPDFSTSATRQDELGEVIIAFQQLVQRVSGAIADQKQTEQQLQQFNQALEAKIQARTAVLEEREQFLQTVLDTFPLSVFWKDCNSVYLGCNRNFLRDAGLASVDEIIGKTDYDLPWGETEAEDYRADDRQVITSNTPKLGIIETQTPADGHQIWLETNKMPLHDLEKTVIGVLGTYQDITVRKRAETALIRSEAKSRAILAAIPDLMFRVSADGIYREFVTNGSEFEAFFAGRNPVGLSMSDLIPADIAVQKRQAMARALQTDTLQIYEQQLHIGEQTRYEEVRVVKSGEDEVLFMVRDITERKKTEEQLLQLSTRLNLAVESAGIGIWDWDVTENVLVWDDQMYALYGLTPIQFISAYESWCNGIHPDDRAAAELACQQTLAGEKTYDEEFRVVHPDGTVRFIKAHALVQRNAQGEAQRMIGVNYDITDRKQAEIAMKQQLAAIEAAIDGVGILRGDEYLYLNQAHVELFGYSSPEELVNKTWHCLYSPEELQRFEQEVFPVLGQAGAWRGEAIATRKDGSTFAEGLSLTLLDDGLLICVCRDISNLKQAEAALRESEVRYRSIYDQTAVGLVNATLKGTFLEVNPRFCEMLGYSRQELMTKTVPEITHPDDLAKFSPDQQRLFDGEIPYFFQEKRYLRKDGSALWASTGVSIVRDAQGQPKHTLAVIQDISERKRLDAERRQAEKALQAKTEELQQSYQTLKDTQLQLIQAEKMSSLGQLVAGIAHEINNPVSFIYGNLTPALAYAEELTQLIRLYQEAYPHPPQAIAAFTQVADIDYIFSDFPKLLASMKTGATRIRDIVQSLRTFSRLDQADREAIDLHENIDTTLVILQNRLNGRAGNPKIQVIKNYGDLPQVECYAGLLNQVFMNVLVNAIDAIEAQQAKADPDYLGCITITTAIAAPATPAESIALSAFDPPIPNDPPPPDRTQVDQRNKVKISIVDNGVGIDSDVQAQIFNPFFTTKSVGIGTGMGLSISYQIITGDHQGQLSFHSSPNVGTEFVIELWQTIPAPTLPESGH